MMLNTEYGNDDHGRGKQTADTCIMMVHEHFFRTTYHYRGSQFPDYTGNSCPSEKVEADYVQFLIH